MLATTAPPLPLQQQSPALSPNYNRMVALSKEERIPDRMMDLSKEERIELVLLSGREGWSYCKIAEEFNLRHPYRCIGLRSNRIAQKPRNAEVLKKENESDIFVFLNYYRLATK
ncbi:Hypothetical predicted protein [Octopus vulgaris]|uniref:Uncharacterized protein n=1 Tax=Octopus vulgaris TaxID=6645 RepID=A0AA36F290_OCTVU|nr:Hypothetical predicted protein [Octopus vulgaris]